MNTRKLNGFIGFAFVAVAAMLVLTACQKKEADSKPADVDYYTCTMHPSVKSQDPNGKCPICSMNLVPVMKKGAAAPGMGGSNAPGPTSVTEPGKSDSDAALSEFAVPVERRQMIGVTYATVSKRRFEYTARAAGIVAADKQRRWNYVTRAEGYIDKLFVFSPGEIVGSNAPLLTVYSPELFTAQKEYVNALQMRDRAKSNGSPDVLKGAEELMASARERMKLWNMTEEQIAGLDRGGKPQEYLTLYSPFRGVVEKIGVEQGGKVMPGEGVVEIADLSKVWVWAQFYQDDLGMLQKGLPVTVSSSSYPGCVFPGKISIVDPFMNDATRTARVRIDVENADMKLRPEMYVDVGLTRPMGEGLAVTASAILPTGLHNVAFVDKGGGKLEPRYVELGRKYGDYYEVTSELKENERVVASANFLIDAEARVQGALKSW